jgi:ABC-type multidrug transport system fused ATPase/permease subunit
MPPSGKGAVAPPVAQTPLSPLKLLRWARQSIAGIVGPQLIANFIGQAQREVSAPKTGASPEASGQSAQAPANAEAPANEQAPVSTETPSATPPSGGSGEFSFLDYVLPNDTKWTAVLFAITALIAIALAFGNRVGMVWLNTLMLQRLQSRLHDKLIQLGPSYHSKHDMGETSAVIMQYSAGAQPMLRDVLSFPFVRGVSLATAIVFLFYNLSDLQGQDGVVYVLLAALLIVLPVGGWWLSSKLRSAYGAVRERLASVNNALVDSLTAPQEVQLMDAAPRRSAAFMARLKELAQAQVQAAVQSEKSNQFQAAVPTLLQIGLILWAVFVVGGDAVQAVVGIYLFVPRVVQPIQELIQFYGGLNAAWPNIEKIGSVLEQPPEIEDKGRKTAADLKSYDLAVSGLTFRPLPDLTVLDHIHFTFPRNKITALIGLSGSGKSTVLRLVSRLFDPNEGKVMLGDTDIRQLKLSSLRSLIASVSQFPLFIEADVRENMRLTVPDASDGDMQAACRAADIWTALEKLSPSDPLAAPVPRMAGKAGLSGGERRRLAIARAILADPRILLLDEPVAGIDAMSVKKIAEELRRAAEGRTIILVEHDMDLIASLADIVCCLKDGRITDVGTPEELTARPSLFAKLLKTRRAYGAEEMEVEATVPVRRVEEPGATKGPGEPPPPGQEGRAKPAAGGPQTAQRAGQKK